MIFSTGLLLCINWNIFVFKSSGSGSSLDLDRHRIGSGSSLDLDHHHWTGSGSSLDLDHHGTSPQDLDHHSIWIIITGSRSSLDLDQYHGCYLMILLITGISIEPALFHAGCRPNHHVGIFPALTSNLLIRKACPTLTSNQVETYNHIRKAQHSHSPAWQDITIIYEKASALVFDLLVIKAYFHPGKNTSYSQWWNISILSSRLESHLAHSDRIFLHLHLTW